MLATNVAIAAFSRKQSLEIIAPSLPVRLFMTAKLCHVTLRSQTHWQDFASNMGICNILHLPTKIFQKTSSNVYEYKRMCSIWIQFLNKKLDIYPAVISFHHKALCRTVSFLFHFRRNVVFRNFRYILRVKNLFWFHIITFQEFCTQFLRGFSFYQKTE